MADLSGFYTRYLSSYLGPAVNCLDRWQVPYQQIADKVTTLALPQIKLVSWLALVMSPAPSLMVMVAALTFVLEPIMIKRFSIAKTYLHIPEGFPKTKLEAFAGTFFNHRAPAIAEIQSQLVQDSNNETLTQQLAFLQREDNKLSASQQALFFGISLIVVHLLPGPLLYPFVMTFGVLVGDHLYRTARRTDATESGAEPVYGYENLLANCLSPSVENESEAASPPIQWTLRYAWSLFAEHANPLIQPITTCCARNEIPLVPLIRKLSALAVPKIKCVACIAILALVASAVTLPYATILASSIWLIFDSLGGPLIKTLSTGETYLEKCVCFFDNRQITLKQEAKDNKAIINRLQAKYQSNEQAIQEWDATSRRESGVTSTYNQAIDEARSKCEQQNEEINQAIETYQARNHYIEQQRLPSSTSVERQAAIFAMAYIAAKLIGHYWIYYVAVAIGGGILLGNHVYHWANREEGWEVVDEQ